MTPNVHVSDQISVVRISRKPGAHDKLWGLRGKDRYKMGDSHRGPEHSTMTMLSNHPSRPVPMTVRGADDQRCAQ